jgi:hypothetical protein
MINWNDIKINQELNITLVEDNMIYKVKGILLEYEWGVHRKPIIANLQVISTTDPKLKKGDIMRLPIITRDNEESFLVFNPSKLNPNHELHMKAKVTTEKLISR